MSGERGVVGRCLGLSYDDQNDISDGVKDSCLLWFILSPTFLLSWSDVQL